MAIECVRLPAGGLALAPCVPPHQPAGHAGAWLPPTPQSDIHCLPAACPALARSGSVARAPPSNEAWASQKEGGGRSAVPKRSRYIACRLFPSRSLRWWARPFACSCAQDPSFLPSPLCRPRHSG
jgi:hypothetical protein